MKVLAIDDNPDNLVSLTAMLRSFLPDCQTATALSGSTGIERARAFHPDTILLDIQMPGMDGFQACRVLKQDPTLRHIPVIFLTAQNTDAASRIHGLEIGGDAFLAKPVEPGELMAQVRAMVRIKLAEDLLRGEKQSLKQAVEERTASLAENKALLEAIFQNVPVPMLVVDSDRVVHSANQAAGTLAGDSADALTNIRGGQAMRCLASLNDAGGCGFGDACHACAIRRTVQDTFQTGQSHFQVEASLTVRRGNGTLNVSLLVSTTPLLTGGNRMVLVCLENVTERKQLESQLLHAQKMEAVGQLAGGVAHDFRNQLAVIQGYGEMLQRRSLVTEKGQPLLNEILGAARKGALLTGQLLAFSRNDMLQPTVVNVSAVVAKMAGSLGHLVGEDVVISIVGDQRDCPAELAINQFEQAMMNLVANARDAMPEGGQLTLETATVEVDEQSARMLPEAKAGQYVCVSVNDTGGGMDPQTLARLFEPFFTTKPRGEGTGLGLAMAYGFVRQSGGFIGVQSELGKGTTFRLYFPLASTVAEPVADNAQHPDVPGGVETVLVVEDQEHIRRLLADSLREAGYTVLQAADAQDACQVAEDHNNRIDLLITDVIMPGLSGVELARRMRQTRKDIPVLFLSGYGGKTLSQHGLDLDRAELIPKPFHHDQLLATMRRMLDAGRE